MASNSNYLDRFSLNKWLRFVDKQIDKEEGIECLKLALYTEVKYSEISKDNLKPSDLFRALEKSEAMQKRTNPTEATLSTFVYCLRSVGASLRGKWCVMRMKKYGISEVDPLNVEDQTPKFRFNNQCLLKIYRRIRKTESEEKLKHFFGEEDILDENHRNFDSTPHMFILLLQQQKITPGDQTLLIRALKESDAKHCFVCVKAYRRKFRYPDVEEIEKEVPDDDDPFVESSSSGAPDSLMSHGESDGDEVHAEKQTHLPTRKREKGSNDAGEGSKPLPIVRKKKKKNYGSFSSGSAGSAASKKTLVATSPQGGFCDTIAARQSIINEGGSESDEDSRARSHLLPRDVSDSSSQPMGKDFDTNNNTLAMVEPEGKVRMWCGRFAAVVALIILVATVAGFVLTSKVGTDFSSSLDYAAYEDTTMVVHSIDQLHIKSIRAREDIQYEDISLKVQFILADTECSNLPLLTDRSVTNHTKVNNMIGLYLMHGSYISLNICATANDSSPERGEVFILSNLTKARDFDPKRDSGNVLVSTSFEVGYSQDKQHPWICTPVNCTVNDDGYYSVIFLEPSYPVQYNYTSNILGKYINLPLLRSNWNCTVVDNERDDYCTQELPWAIKETCLIARIENHATSNTQYFTHIAVDFELRVEVLILGYVFSGLSLLIFIISMVFCCLGYKKQLGKIKNIVV